MPGAVARRAAGLAAIGVALILGGCGTSASPSSGTGTSSSHRGGSPGQSSGGASAPAKDTFSGSITAGTGAYSGARGRVRIYLHPHGSGLARAVRAVVQSTGCGSGSGRCIELTGELRGTLDRAGHQLPDTGEGFDLAGTGQLVPVGRVTATGSVTGTGFIIGGHEGMVLKVTSSSGTLTINAESGPVPGFHSP